MTRKSRHFATVIAAPDGTVIDRIEAIERSQALAVFYDWQYRHDYRNGATISVTDPDGIVLDHCEAVSENQGRLF